MLDRDIQVKVLMLLESLLGTEPMRSDMDALVAMISWLHTENGGQALRELWESLPDSLPFELTRAAEAFLDRYEASQWWPS